MDQPYKRRKLFSDSPQDSKPAFYSSPPYPRRRQDHVQEYLVEQHRHMNDAHGHSKPRGRRHEPRQVLGTGDVSSSVIQPTASQTTSSSSATSNSVTSSASLSTTSLGSTVSGSSSIGLSGSVVVGLTGASTSTAISSTSSSSISASTATTTAATSSISASISQSSSSRSNGTSTTITSSTPLAASSYLSSTRSATNGTSILHSTSATQSSSTSASRGLNLTTSTFVFSDSTTTYTSYSVFGGARTSDEFSTTVTTMSDGAVATVDYERQEVIATLSDGDVTTFYGSFSAVSTLSPSSTSSTSTSLADGTSSSATSAFSLATSTASSSSSSSSNAAGAGSTAGSATSSASTSSSTLSSSSSSNDSSTPPTSELAGGIVGGVAGLAVVLLVALALFRWYRKRMANMQPLTRGEATPALAGGPGAASGAPKMSQRSGIAPVLAPLLGRRGLKNKRLAEGGPAPVTTERGFQRISGRKLPSAFSDGIEGMSTTRSPPPLMPAAFENGRESYRNSSAWSNEALDPFADPQDGSEIVSPRTGPARVPTVHPGGGWISSPASAVTMTSPSWPLRSGSDDDIVSPMGAHFAPGAPSGRPGTASSEGNRGSRFTEEV